MGARVLVAQQHNSQADMVSKQWLFCLKFESSIGRKDTIFTKRESDILPEALPIIFIYLMEVLKHSRSNGCVSLSHSVIFPRLTWCPNVGCC